MKIFPGHSQYSPLILQFIHKLTDSFLSFLEPSFPLLKLQFTVVNDFNMPVLEFITSYVVIPHSYKSRDPPCVQG